MARRIRGDRHTLVCDNYFTSVKAFLAIKDIAPNFHAVGTLKQRSDVPAKLLWPKKNNRRPRGSARFLRLTNRALLLQEWQDGGLVRVLTTGFVGFRGKPQTYGALPGIAHVDRWLLTGSGGWTRVQVPCPPAVKFYQEKMGGVDKSDQV